MFWYAHLAFGLAIVSIFTVDPMLLVLAALVSLVPDMDRVIAHRQWFSHSIYAALILSGVAFAASGFQPMYALVAFLALSSHVLLDSVTKSGVPILHPWKKKHYGLRWFSAHNRKVNAAVTVMSLLFLLFNMWKSYPPHPTFNIIII